jgi:hypothetical protein
MIAVPVVYGVVGLLVFAAGATDRSFTKRQALKLALTWPGWLPQIVAGF